MQRRTFLIGTAGTALGSSALIGSGAFTTGTLENREANIDVVHDSVGAISLIDTMPGSDMVGYSDNPGRLEIDFTAGGAAGANVGGQFQLGYNWNDDELERKEASQFVPRLEDVSPHLDEGDLDGDGEFPLTWYNSAFAIWNRGTQTYDLTLEYDASDDLEAADAHGGGSTVTIYLFNGDDPVYEYGELEVGTGESKSITIEADTEEDGKEFRPNKRVFVSMEIDTTDGTPMDDLSGDMTITADNPQ